ncbi:MAG: hypothetical protein Q8Q40_14280 [Methylococcaceae bacterium]|nr:hypothetical protein [Methylococcaceae bacterium]MDP3905125.1 hypothetical protein [Methylococcaceae bacterium]
MKTYPKRCLVFLSLMLAMLMSVSIVFAKNNSTNTNKVLLVKKPHSVKAIAGKKTSKSKADKNAQPESASPVIDKEQQKSLDLSLSIDDLEKNALNKQLDHAFETAPESIFAIQKKPPRSLTLDGQILMSQEPEADKKKSMDGAGITINLKR